MNCDKMQDLISEAIDGSLSPSEARDFDDHLAGCPPCRAAFGSVKESLALLGELPALEVGNEFDDAVWRRIRAEQRAGEPARGTWSARVRDWAGAFKVGTSWRWAPLGAAAAILAWVAMGPNQMPVPQVTRSEAKATRVADVVPDVDVLSRSPDFTPVEFPAGMPKAVEQFISSGRDMTPRYRQSNYNYPFRPVSDPVVVPMIPVSNGAAPIQSPNPNSSGPETGVSVLAF